MMIRKIAQVATFAILAVMLNNTTCYATTDTAEAKKAATNETLQIILMHTVNDYASWKKAYAEHAPGHAKNALKELAMYQNVDNPNYVTIIFETNDLAKAKAFLIGPDSAGMYKSAGVVDKPVILFVHQAK
jgi:hypothetical protein